MAIPWDVSLKPARKAKQPAGFKPVTSSVTGADVPRDTTETGGNGFTPQTSPMIPGTDQSSTPGTEGFYNYQPYTIPGTQSYTPDYASLIQDDPAYRQTAANLSAQGIADAATRKAGVGQALTQFGEVPDFASTASGFGLSPDSPLYQMLMGDVTPDVQQAAQGLTNAGLSTVAGLSQTHTKALGDLMDQLAARGIVRSGATGVGTNLEDQNYGQQQFKARTDLLTYLAGVQQAFAQSESGRQNQLSTALGDATTRAAQLYPSQAASPDQTYQTPSWVPGTQGTGTYAPGYTPPTIPPIPSGNQPGGVVKGPTYHGSFSMPSFVPSGNQPGGVVKGPTFHGSLLHALNVSGPKPVGGYTQMGGQAARNAF